MNHIFSYASSVPQYFASAFTDSLLPELSTKQKKILVISSIAFSVFTAIVAYYRYYIRRNSSPFIGGHVSHNVPPSSQKNSPQPSPNSSSNSSPKRSSSPSPKLKVPSPTPWGLSKTPSSVIKNSGVSPIIPSLKPIINPVNNPVHSPASKSDLAVIEDTIRRLQEELTFQQQILQFANSTPPKAKDSHQSSNIHTQDDSDLGLSCNIHTQDDSDLGLNIDDQSLIDDIPQRGMNDALLKIFDLEEQLRDILRTYPKMMRKHLEDKFSGYSHKDTQEIYMHLALLSGIMDNNANNHDFIHDSLRQIDRFLSETFFTSSTELCLQETKKIDLAVFHEFFSIADSYLPIIKNKDPELTLNLKVKLANLPLRDEIKKDYKGNPINHPSTHLPTIDKITDRKQKFPNVHLTEQEQLGILVNHLQSEEDKNLNIIIQNLYQKFYTKDVKKLSRLASNKHSTLSVANKLKLRSALEKCMGAQAPANWDDFDKVQFSLTQFFGPIQSSGGYGYYSKDNVEILNLHRASKAKKYFAQQIGLPNDKVQIPRWYHATNHKNVALITQSGQVNVEHKQAFKGAWVSSQREKDFGNSVFVFNHRITKLDPNVFIGYEKITERWRGVQCPIPLLDSSKTPYVSLMGVYTGAKKSARLEVEKDLHEKGVVNSVVVSVDQVDYIQKVVIKVLGSPDLPERWWGRADFSKLEEPLTKQ